MNHAEVLTDEEKFYCVCRGIYTDKRMITCIGGGTRAFAPSKFVIACRNVVFQKIMLAQVVYYSPFSQS